MPGNTTQIIICQLLSYVRTNPTASDTAEGIARWWLNPEEWVDVDKLTQALGLLVVRRAFAERVAADGRRQYRRSCSDSELQSLLAELLHRPSAGDGNAADADH